MRILLFTGKGGVGKTTTAAATAVRLADRGLTTLVLSTDAAHSLAEAFDRPLGAQPEQVRARLFAQQVDTRGAFERSWREVQRYLVSVLDVAGVAALEAEELTVLPGADEVFALLEMRAQAASGRYDAVVVDCAPTAETLRLLALPEALRAYTDRLFPVGDRIARVVRPVLGRVAGMPMPGDPVVEAAQRLHAELAEAHRMLTDRDVASVRLVLTPESVVVAEARRTLTSLALYGYRVDGVVANRVFPAEGADGWRAGWVAAQTAQLAEVAASFAPLPVQRAPYRPAEPVGFAELAAFADDLYADTDPLAGGPAAEPLTVERDGDGFLLGVALPLAQRGDVDLARSGDELVVTVGAHRRLLTLPSALRRCVVTGAALRDGRLGVSFEPDPDLWMRT